MLTAVILGAGCRGAETYGRYSLLYPEKLKINAICDLEQQKLDKYSKIFNVPKEKCFLSSEELFSKGKLADVIFVCTQDRDHYKHTMAALDLNYDILLEKPISPILTECDEIVKKAKEKNRIIIVCHVMRYTAFAQKIKDTIDKKTIGGLIAINQVENVGYWHQAHSFVRGNWRDSSITSPMILQKCCHDMDLLYWMCGNSNCDTVSSLGELNFFKKEKAPEGATPYCLDGCKVKEKCPYDAEKIYVNNFEKLNLSEEEKLKAWPYISVVLNPTAEKLRAAIEKGPYGRCVFYCDNNVVDHQTVNIKFKNGVTANLTMTGFSAYGGRQLKVMGTLGEIIGDEIRNTIEINIYGEAKQIVNLNDLTDDLSGHGGGDKKLMSDFINIIESRNINVKSLTNIENSLQSHIMSIAAEESRLKSGQMIDIDKFKANIGID